MTFCFYLSTLLDPEEYEFYKRHGFDFDSARKENQHLAELIFYLYGFVFYQARCIRDGDWPNPDCRQWELLTGVV
jgi:hypothetical protein